MRIHTKIISSYLLVGLIIGLAGKIILVRQDGDRGKAEPSLRGEYYRLTEKIETEFAELIQPEKEDLDQTSRPVTETHSHSQPVYYAAGVFTLALAIVLGIFGRIFRPIYRLTDATGRMAGDDLEVAVDAASNGDRDRQAGQGD
ncbi:MAG: hypothetical protein WC001_06295 [Desulfurivibrionaceae bacterium]